MPEFDKAPLTRHEALAPLSRDHYIGLVQARHLIRSAGEDAPTRRKVLAEFVDAWERDIVEHFQDEERLLAGLIDDEDRQRLLDEHARISDCAARLRAMRRQVDPDPVVLKEAGEMLEQHIRWEERELFGRLQSRVSDRELAELHEHTAAIEKSRPRGRGDNQP